MAKGTPVKRPPSFKFSDLAAVRAVLHTKMNLPRRWGQSQLAASAMFREHRLCGYRRGFIRCLSTHSSLRQLAKAETLFPTVLIR